MRDIEDLMDDVNLSYSDLEPEKDPDEDEEKGCPHCTSQCMICLGMSWSDFM